MGLFLIFASTPAGAVTCFLSGSQTQGLSRVCFYQCASSTIAITVHVNNLCPQAIDG